MTDNATTENKVAELICRHTSDFSVPGTVLFLAHFVAGSDFTGEIVARMVMVPPELFTRIGLTSAGFEQAQEYYRAVAGR